MEASDGSPEQGGSAAAGGVNAAAGESAADVAMVEGEVGGEEMASPGEGNSAADAAGAAGAAGAGDASADKADGEGAAPPSKRIKVDATAAAAAPESAVVVSETGADPAPPAGAASSSTPDSADAIDVSSTSTTTTATTSFSSGSASLGFHNAGGFGDFTSSSTTTTASGFGGGGGFGGGFGASTGTGFGADASSSSSFGAGAGTATSGDNKDIGFGTFKSFDGSGGGGFGGGGFSVFGGGSPATAGSDDAGAAISGDVVGDAKRTVSSPAASGAGSAGKPSLSKGSPEAQAALRAAVNGEENESNVIDPLRVKVYELREIETEKEDDKGEGAVQAPALPAAKEGTASENADGTEQGGDAAATAAATAEKATKWVALGVGELRYKELTGSSARGKASKRRVLMRREYGASTHAGELKLNVAIHEHMGCEIVADKNVRLTTLGVNAVPGAKPRTVEDGPLVFLIRFKKAIDAELLANSIKRHIEKCKTIAGTSE